MTKGDVVKVFPHGDPNCSALGVVVMFSTNARSIAVAFDEKPPFVMTSPEILSSDPRRRSAPLNFHPEHGVIFLATRYDVGPWIELFGGGHYEVELYPSREDATEIVRKITGQ